MGPELVSIEVFDIGVDCRLQVIEANNIRELTVATSSVAMESLAVVQLGPYLRCCILSPHSTK